MESVAVREVGDTQPLEGVEGPRALGRRCLHVVRQPQRAEDAAAHDVAYGQVHAHLVVHGGRHDAERLLDVGEQRPRLTAEAHGRLVAVQGEDLAREQLDERRLARAVRAEERHVLAFGQVEPVDGEDRAPGAHHPRVAEREQRRGGRGG